MKKKLGIVLGILILALIIGVVALFVINGKKTDEPAKETVTITFNVNGGSSVEAVKVEKGKSITLPTTAKDKYNFLGWYDGDKKVDETTTFDKDTTLTAKWEAIPEDAKTFVITFDSKGGSAVNKITVECDKTLSLPANPTKSGYKFVSWADKNGKVILNGAKLECEDVTL